MSRSTRLSFLVLGASLTAMSGVGVFSAVTDSASTGVHRVETPALASAVDLQIATIRAEGCETFGDDTTDAFTLQGEPRDAEGGRQYCLRNVGSDSARLSVATVDVQNVDFDCTGDEAGAGDTTCGGNGAGEVTGRTRIQLRDCVSPRTARGTAVQATGYEVPSSSLDYVLRPGATVCVLINVGQDDVSQVAQSDRATFRVRFTGQA